MKDEDANVDPLAPIPYREEERERLKLAKPTNILLDTSDIIHRLEPDQKHSSSEDSDKVEDSDEKDGNKETKTPPNVNLNTKTSIDASPEDKNSIKAERETPEEGGSFKGKFKFSLQFFKVYIQTFCMFLGFLSLYWGTMYNRQSRYTNLEYVIVLQDLSFTTENGTVIEPLVFNEFSDMVFNNHSILQLGGWQTKQPYQIEGAARKYNISIQDELIRMVHHQKIWVGIYIQPNATQQIYNALASGNVEFAKTTANSLINCTYEEGRHYSSSAQYVVKHLRITQQTWASYYIPRIYNAIFEKLSTDQKMNLLLNSSTLALLNSGPTLKLNNLSPTLPSQVLGPSQLGLIYAQLFSFHQFNFSLQIHTYLKDKLKFRDYLIYRVVASHINCFLLAFVYCLVTIIYQVPTSETFGKAGFLVYWCIMYLFLAACGGINELVVSLLFYFKLNAMLPVWMVANIVINMSPTFSTLQLMPKFYGYGNALPMYCVYHLIKVLFFNTWKGHMGRLLGILIIWIVFTNILLVGFIIYTNRKEKAKQLKEAREKEDGRLQEWLEKKRSLEQEHTNLTG